MNPAIPLGLLLATILALIYHVIRGGSIRRLGLFVIASCVSFFIGQALSEMIGWTMVRVGVLNLFPAILAAILGLIVTDILTPRDSKPSSPPGKRSKK